MIRVKFEFSDGQGKVCKYIIWRLRSVEENVVSYVTSSKQVTELTAWVKYDTEGALQRTSLSWFYSISPIWNTSDPHHGWCQLFWNYLWFLSAIPHKFTAVFMLHKVHGQFFMLQLPLNHFVIWLPNYVQWADHSSSTVTINQSSNCKPHNWNQTRSWIHENCSNMISLMGRVSHYPKKRGDMMTLDSKVNVHGSHKLGSIISRGSNLFFAFTPRLQNNGTAVTAVTMWIWAMTFQLMLKY